MCTLWTADDDSRTLRLRTFLAAFDLDVVCCTCLKWDENTARATVPKTSVELVHGVSAGIVSIDQVVSNMLLSSVVDVKNMVRGSRRRWIVKPQLMFL